MPATAAQLARPRQWYTCAVGAVYTGRTFRASDPATDGTDTAHDGQTFPPAADTLDAHAAIPAFAGLTGYGQISGSLGQGGWSGALALPAAYADDELVGLDLGVAASFDGAAVGAATLLRCYVQQIGGNHTWDTPSLALPVATSHVTLEQRGTGRAVDFFAGSAEPEHDTTGGLALADMIAHYLDGHTNLAPRSPYTVALPAHTIAAYGFSAGAIMGALRAVARNFGVEPIVYFDRNDTLTITAHPNLIGDTYPGLSSPVLDLTAAHELHGNGRGVQITEAPANRYNFVTLVATDSEGVELVATAGTGSGDGSPVPPVTGLRIDDADALQDLADLYLEHVNRRIAVTIPVGLNTLLDIGQIVTYTATAALRSGTVNWARKPFLVTAYSMMLDFANGTARGVLTLDEVTV